MLHGDHSENSPTMHPSSSAVVGGVSVSTSGSDSGSGWVVDSVSVSGAVDAGTSSTACCSSISCMMASMALVSIPSNSLAVSG